MRASIGDYGEIALTPEESRLNVRARLRAAAQRRGLAIELQRTAGDLLRFYIEGRNGINAPAPPTSRSELTASTMQGGDVRRQGA